MKSVSKRFYLILLVLLTALLLFACNSESGGEEDSDGNSEPDENVEATENEPEEEEQEPVTLTFAWTWDEESFHNHLGEDFYDHFPHVTFDYVQAATPADLEELMATGVVPDLITDIGKAGLDQLELSYDLSDLIEQYDFDLSRFPETTIEALRNDGDGGIYLLPFRGQVFYNYYNKDIFDTFGVPYPEDDMTWAEIVELASRVTGERDGIQYLGLDFEMPGLMYDQIGIPFLDPETHELTYENEDEIREILHVFEDMYAIPGNIPGEDIAEESSSARFRDGLVAMLPMWNRVGSLANWSEDGTINYDFDFTTFPFISDDHQYFPRNLGNLFSIGRTSENKETAFEVLMYFSSDEFQIKEGINGNPPSVDVPEVQEAFGSGREALEGKNIEAFYRHPQHAGAENTSPYEGIAVGEFGALRQELMEGNKDVNTLIREFYDRVDALVKEEMGME